MSTKDKLYNLEITPPNGVWPHIQSELDAADQGMNYPSALYQAEIKAPTGAWEKIAAALSESSQQATASEKLAALAIDPPAATWQKIAATLDTTQEAAIPPKKRLSPFIRYAAAAVLIGIMAWGAVFLLNTKKQNNDLAVGTVTNVQPAPVHTTHAAPENNTAANADNNPATDIASEEARNDAALEESKHTFAKLDNRHTGKIKAAADFYFADPAATVSTRGLNMGDDDNPNYTPDPASEPSRYIMLLTPEGNIIRMSRKLSNMVCCVSGEEQDKDCQDQMRKWREKLACSSAAHSPGNFMDILSLAHALQQEND